MIPVVRIALHTLMPGEWPTYLHEEKALVFDGRSWVPARVHDDVAISSMEIPFTEPEEVETMLLRAFFSSREWSFVVHVSFERSTAGVWSSTADEIHRYVATHQARTIDTIAGTREEMAADAYRTALAASVIRS